jgi:hypothetical protein
MRHTKAFALLLLAGCGRFQVHPDALPYVAEFYHEAALRGVTVSQSLVVNFLPLESAGECTREWYTPPTVTIGTKQWTPPFNEEDLDSWRRAIVFHELGHCLLGRRHTTPNLDVRSFMEPSIVVPRHAQEFDKELRDEMFFRVRKQSF